VTQPRAVIIGAGALGLGCLAERLAGDYDLFLADVGSREDMLHRVEAQQGFTVNLCSPDGIHPKRVAGHFEVAVTDAPDGKTRLDRALRVADLVLTATSRRSLDTVVPVISPALNARDRAAWLLFCENGLHIARAYAADFGPRTVLTDTVMSRMCRFGDSQHGRYQPLWPGYATCLVVEDYSYLPLDVEVCGSGPFSSAFSLIPHAEFILWEDIKLFLHNGMHAFVAYRAYLEGIQRFVETPAWIQQKARSVMLNEVIPAIVHAHACANREQVELYGVQLLERFFNPFFDDTIERGVRGVADKLAPDERLVGGCEYIRRAGIEPRGYAGTIRAGKQILAQQRSAM
jgi:mannitol-1-phosphate/altronate dehydrogenase